MQEVNLQTHPLSGVSLIEASAGTGKTYTITHLYLRCLLELEFDVKQLLVVTFTNAATQELKGRIRQLIYQLWTFLQDSNSQNSELEVLFGKYRQDKKALFNLQKALINFDEASIYSIHGFCQRVLNIFPVETFSLLQQQIIPDERELEQSAIRDYWRLHVVNSDLQHCRWIHSCWKHPDDLLTAIQPLQGFALKLEQIQQESEKQLIHSELLSSWQTLGQSWEKSSEDIHEILLNSPSLNRGRVRQTTVKQLLFEFNRIIKDSIPYGLPAKWELLTQSKLLSCLKKGLQEDRLELDFFKLTELIEHQHQIWIRNQKLSILIQASRYVKKSIEGIKKSAQNISFNDLIKQLSQVLTDDNKTFIQKVNQLYPLAMVDEFQDTDNEQYSIFRTLYQSAINDGKSKTLILIGDPKQAIYSFRGADVFTYQQAKQSTQNHFTLDTNYRSTKQYIELINKIFKHNKNAFIYDQLIQFHNSKASESNNKSITEHGHTLTPLVCWIHPQTEKAIIKGRATDYFAQQCADTIYSILQQKTMLLDGKPVQANDLTILVKTGRQASLMKNKLAELGISSALILRDSVFESAQAREISLLLEVLLEPGDTRRLNGLLSSDLFGWNAQQIYNLQKDNQQLVRLLEQMKVYQQHWLSKGILSMFFKLLEEQQTLQKNIRQIDGERRLTNWMHIVELLQQQSNQHASLRQAASWLKQQREQYSNNNANEDHQLRLESDSNLVRIVTIHKSKGLQYPVVFLPFMWDVKSNRNIAESYTIHDAQGNKKLMILNEDQRERWHQENLAEEVRLLYVAMTRAIYRSYIGWGFIKGAGSSAIAQCLYQQNIQTEKYPFELVINDAAELRQPFEQLNNEFCYVDIIQSENEFNKSKAAEKLLKPQEPAKKFTRKIKQQWRISSYSQLATSGYSEDIDRPDYDAIENTTTETDIPIRSDVLNRFTFQKGAKAGNFLHDILEHQVFDQNIDITLIQHKCQEYGFSIDWIPMLTEWMADILKCDLGGMQLQQLKAKLKISEMEFYMSSKNLQAVSLNELLHKFQYSRPEQFFSFNEIQGFIKGFIDLVFEFDGLYFIADYKSNYLGSLPAFYTKENCKQAMYDHHYHLQYLIYTLALHRFLRQRIKNYDYDRHFGGVYYLFLRGMSANDKNQQGVYFHKPEIEVIQQLDHIFNE